MNITPTMSLDLIERLVGPREFEGPWADAHYSELLVNFRAELVECAKQNGWEDIADVPDDAWEPMVQRSY